MLELIVVLIVLGILSAVAFVTYSALTARAVDSGPQAALNAVAAAEDSAYLRYGSFVGVSQLPGLENSYAYTSAAAAGSAISVALGVGSAGQPTVGLAGLGSGGSCFELAVYPPDSSLANATGTLPSGSSCTGSAALSPSGATW